MGSFDHTLRRDFRLREPREQLTVPAPVYRYMFESDKSPTKQLVDLLHAIALRAQVGGREDWSITPNELWELYKFGGLNCERCEALFLDHPQSIRSIWTVLGCQDSSEPTPDAFSASSVPSLTLGDFVRWESLQILLNPEEHVPFIQHAVRHWGLTHPDTGVVFSPDLPDDCFPQEFDPEVDQWHIDQAKALPARARTPSEVPVPTSPSLLSSLALSSPPSPALSYPPSFTSSQLAASVISDVDFSDPHEAGGYSEASAGLGIDDKFIMPPFLREGFMSFLATMPRRTKYLPDSTLNPKGLSSFPSLDEIGNLFQKLDLHIAIFLRNAMSTSRKIARTVRFVQEALIRHLDTTHQAFSGLNTYCQRVAQQKLAGQALDRPGWRPLDYGSKAALKYIRDAEEAASWYVAVEILIATAFHPGQTSTGAELLHRALRDYSLDAEQLLRRTKATDTDDIPKELMDGIMLRISLLKRLGRIPRPCRIVQDQVDLLCDRPKSASLDGVHVPSVPNPHERVIGASLMVFALAGSMVPACIGFARYYNLSAFCLPGADRDDGQGSICDADFMWLIANAILIVFGFLFNSMPLFKHTSTLVARVTWGFIGVSGALLVMTIASYVLVNKAWSSLLAFCSALFGLGAMFILTHNIGPDASRHVPCLESGLRNMDIVPKIKSS